MAKGIKLHKSLALATSHNIAVICWVCMSLLYASGFEVNLIVIICRSFETAPIGCVSHCSHCLCLFSEVLYMANNHWNPLLSALRMRTAQNKTALGAVQCFATESSDWATQSTDGSSILQRLPSDRNLIWANWPSANAGALVCRSSKYIGQKLSQARCDWRSSGNPNPSSIPFEAGMKVAR